MNDRIQGCEQASEKRGSSGQARRSARRRLGEVEAGGRAVREGVACRLGPLGALGWEAFLGISTYFMGAESWRGEAASRFNTERLS